MPIYWVTAGLFTNEFLIQLAFLGSARVRLSRLHCGDLLINMERESR